MNIKRSIQINGVDYTDKLLSVSDINIGVRDLGFGYISDITAELVFDRSLLNVKGQKVIVGILVNNRSYTYEGIINKVSIKDNKLTLKISHLLSDIKLNPLKTISVTHDDGSIKVYTVPIIYGNGVSFKTEEIALYTVNTADLPAPRVYRWLVADKNFAYAIQDGDVFYKEDTLLLNEKENTIDTNLSDWLELIEEYGTWGTAGAYRRYKLKAYVINDREFVVLRHINVKCYGGKNNGDGTITYTEIPERGIASYWIEDDWDEIKLEYFDKGQLGVSSPNIYIYSSAPTGKDKEIKRESYITTGNFSNPSDIVEDILKINGFTVSKKLYSSLNINLNFQTKENYETIIEKSAEMGLIYVIPNLKLGFDIIPAGEGTSITTLSEKDFLENTFSFEDNEPKFDKLKIIWNKNEYESTYGTGLKEKEYKADYIADITSVDNFGNAYLAYYQKQKYVSFETPIYLTYLDLDVGNIVTVSHNLYGINQNFQIIEKSIRDESIKFRCKEV